MARRKKASGRNVTEAERRGIKIQYRLSEAEAAELQARAEAADLTPNGYARQVMARALVTSAKSP